jgi:sugar phosphate isomerase/epimerase
MSLVSFGFSRRTFLGRAGVALGASKLALSVSVPPRIGVTDWNLNQGANPEAIPLAAKIGFSGLQISFGRELRDGKMPVDNPEVIARYLSLSRQYKLPIDGTCVDRLHDNGLKSDKQAPKWVLDSIRLTKDLGTKVLLLPFFGRWAIQTSGEMDYVGDALRDLGPEAEKAGVVLGIEDMISAKDNVRIMDRSRSQNVKVYYDVGNSTKAGFDVVKEIRWLGNARICQFHLKDNPHYLGEGKIRFGPIIRAIKDIGYSRWANLETDAHPQTLEADMRRNLLYIQRLIRDRY